MQSRSGTLVVQVPLETRENSADFIWLSEVGNCGRD